MPYIKQKRRDVLVDRIIHKDGGEDDLAANLDEIQTAGELQYVMAEMFKSYIKRKGLSYQTLNDIMGALAGAQQENYRRNVISYENSKITENGDI